MTTFHKTKQGEWQTWGSQPVDSFPIQITEWAISDTIPRPVAEEAYKEYVTSHGSRQTLDRLGQRGGFGTIELIVLLYERIKRLQEQIKVLEKRSNCDHDWIPNPPGSGRYYCAICGQEP